MKDRPARFRHYEQPTIVIASYLEANFKGATIDCGHLDFFAMSSKEENLQLHTSKLRWLFKGGLMKYLIQTACAALICVSTHAYAAQNGVNYDPDHSSDYQAAQKANKLDVMMFIIARDLDQMKIMGFTLVKTFYSTYCTIDGKGCANITQLANQRGIRLLLGVYEFPDHPDWTGAQIDAAVAAASAYPKTVVAIAVGNEDMFDYAGNPILNMQKRIVEDMTTIRNRIGNPSIKVTTAQREPDWYRLASSDPYKVLASRPRKS